MNTWGMDDAIALIVKIEAIAPLYGCHVALTGGVLYKVGRRKDLDILFYRIRQVPRIDVDGLIGALELIGLTKPVGSGWIYKAEFNGKCIDIFFPENDGKEEYDRAAGKEAKAEVALMCFNSQQPKFKDGQITEVRSVNYQEYSGDDCGLPNHWMVIVSVAGNQFAEQLYFSDTPDGKKKAYNVKVGNQLATSA